MSCHYGGKPRSPSHRWIVRPASLPCSLMIDLVPAPATLPDGLRIYAVGDVHGCLARPIAHAELIHLGDYIDRGPESAQVIDWLLCEPPVPVQRVVNLMGNHEEM